ncbi:hypothetical protein [Nonomuraea aurantiaca]|uniref:hypothetical protein n=1 Tax=Nonomuraea aurantiaca TaxID=2878562 RepID=UPI001CD9B9C2|nr:hypothetical protein [Nonomuraea aurantiaca]MCA2230467.1 hypothetical protein [Nonomuraea aurantiaca]
MDRNERLRLTQRRRAEQFGACVYALRRGPSARGAEAVFDQALTNGLAVIVAHAWPGKEFKREGYMLPASGLLEVIEANGIPADNGATRVLHDPTKPEFVKSIFWRGPGDEEGLEPNFTEVRGPILKRALEITQEIRHAREVSEQPSESLSAEHLEALDALGDYPEITHAITAEALAAHETQVSANDDAEQARAERYLEALGDDEAQRRADTSEWADQFTPTPGDPDSTTFEHCPVCGYETLVAPYRDGYLDEIGIGHCFVCSYERTEQVAEDLANDLVIRGAIERSD